MAAKKVFITGASSGIGLATADLFASKGWRLVITGRDKKKLEAAASQLRSRHRAEITTLVFDVADRATLAKLQKKHDVAFADVDVLVNNAGLAVGLETVQDADPDDWDQMIDTNVKGLLLTTRAILPGMIKRQSGHVVNLGSTAGHGFYKGGAVYCATKWSVKAITGALRQDVLGSNVRVSSIDPGQVETNFSVVRFKGDAAKAKKVYEGYTPLAPRDVAEAIWWVVERPAHVNIHEILMMPTDQAWTGIIHKRST